jgi:GntR family transcriptional regulator
MNFKESKAIYLQIAERICDEILLLQYKEEERIPSVREYAAIVEVNANTVMRSFDYLQLQSIIYNKRGIGYFVASGARELILSLRRDAFLKEEVAYFFKQLHTLDISIDEIRVMFGEFIKKQNIGNKL